MTQIRSDFNYGSMECSCRAYNSRLNRTMIQSDFDYQDVEFTSQAIGNRQKRHQNMTHIMKWEFQKDLLNLMTKVRTAKPEVDDHPPKRPNANQWRKNREEHEQIRLDGIQKENREMLERLRKIHNRPRSTFCHLKRRGDYLVKGDAYSLPPPKKNGLYLVQMYKKLKLNNPVMSRKSIRVQQEMLTSATNLVQKSDKNKPSEEMIETQVQATLNKEDEILPDPEPQVEPLSPVEVVQLVTPDIDAQEIEDIVMALLSTPEETTSLGQEESLDLSQTQDLEMPSPINEISSDGPQSTSETESETTQSATTSETPGDNLGETTQSLDVSETPGGTTQSLNPSDSPSG